MHTFQITMMRLERTSEFRSERVERPDRMRTHEEHVTGFLFLPNFLMQSAGISCPTRTVFYKSLCKNFRYDA